MPRGLNALILSLLKANIGIFHKLIFWAYFTLFQLT